MWSIFDVGLASSLSASKHPRYKVFLVKADLGRYSKLKPYDTETLCLDVPC